MKYCQNCGSEIEDKALFCAKCGFKIVDVETVATRFCSNCGSKIAAVANYCTNCGIKLIGNGTLDGVEAAHNEVYNESVRPDPVTSFKLFLKDTFKASKRLGRADYWWARLTMYLCSLTLALLWLSCISRIAVYSNSSVPSSAGIFFIILLIVTAIFVVWALIANITAYIRRLHDIGLSGAWVLLLLLGIGDVVLLIMTLIPSKQINNRYI